MTATIALASRDEIVTRIAGHIADRDAFILAGLPPTAVPDLAHVLRRIPTWSAYLDGGTPAVLCTSDPDILAAAGILTETTVVVTVPKTVPADTLGAALGQHIPADGLRDLLMLQAPGQPIFWPVLYVDALGMVDPKAAAQIRAIDVRCMS